MYFPAAESVTVDSSLLSSLAQVLSHIFFIPTLVVSIKLRVWIPVAVTLMVFIFSDAYHICKADWYCFGMGNTSYTLENGTVVTPGLDNMRPMDHISSPYASVMILFMIVAGSAGGGADSIVPAIGLLFLVIYAGRAYPYEIQSLVIVIAGTALVIAAYVLIRQRMNLPPPDRFNIKWISAALFFSLVAFILYFIQVIPYAVAHPIWHILISFSLFCVVIGVNQTRLREWTCLTCQPEREEDMMMMNDDDRL